jgi:hypothetical protein
MGIAISKGGYKRMPKTENKKRVASKTANGGELVLAQVVLTTAESKKLIAKAVARLDVVQQAAKHGIVALHPSSSTYFIVEEITGSKPKTNYWVCGVVTPRGMCVEMAMVLGSGYAPKEISADPGDLRATWIIENGKLAAEESLSSLFDRMTPSDVYVKGVNALDAGGNVGILFGHQGSMGYIQSARKKKGFSMIYPVGLEKLIPISIRDAAKEAKPTKCEYAMGMPVGLFPGPAGTTVNELRAIEILSGAEAVPIASGGLGGAEGAITLMIKGEGDQVRRALEFVEQSKGAEFPQLRLCNCEDCPVPHCRFPPTGKPWASA